MKSTPDTPKKTEPKSILLIGPPGGGKTTLAMQFPGVAFLDCDRNLDASERFVRTKVPTLEYDYFPVTYDDTGKPVETSDCFDRLLMLVNSLKSRDDLHTVCIDGLTMINEFVVRKVLKDQGNKSVMEPHFWTPFKSHLMNLLVSKLRNLGKTTIVTCHETIIEKPNTDKQQMMIPVVMGYRPAVQGGIVDYLGGFFTDMWRCTCEPGAGGTVVYTLQVARDSKSDLKNSLGLPSEGFTWKTGELGYNLIKPFFDKLK